MDPSDNADYTFAGAAAASSREMMKLTPGQRINRAAELWEAGRLLAEATNRARQNRGSGGQASSVSAKKSRRL